jgi:hypothetical protein
MAEKGKKKVRAFFHHSEKSTYGFRITKTLDITTQ